MYAIRSYYVNGHISICDQATVTGMAMVMRSISEPGIYSSGVPAQPNKHRITSYNVCYTKLLRLFNAAPEQMQVVIHPQSVIHSMVQYKDGSVLAQLGQPDMRTPIAHAMSYPDRIASGVAPLDFCALGELTFLAPDYRNNFV